jgi:hypothetical protein
MPSYSQRWQASEEASLKTHIPNLTVFGGSWSWVMVADHLTSISFVQRKYTPSSIKQKVSYILARTARAKRDAVSDCKKRRALNAKQWVLGGDRPFTGPEFDEMVITQRMFETCDDDCTESLSWDRLSCTVQTTEFQQEHLVAQVTTEKSKPGKVQRLESEFQTPSIIYAASGKRRQIKPSTKRKAWGYSGRRGRRGHMG